ncbi:MAG: hypothetical protein QNJ56_09590 [Gammaproteobacteria bacterium]|nr:hypothetical protein [Gammaproteobacteria bacterium]
MAAENTETIPGWASWLAMDADGQWWCYEAEPHQHDTGWYENEVGRCLKLNDFNRVSGRGWRDSLQPINRCQQGS